MNIKNTITVVLGTAPNWAIDRVAEELGYYTSSSNSYIHHGRDRIRFSKNEYSREELENIYLCLQDHIDSLDTKKLPLRKYMTIPVQGYAMQVYNFRYYGPGVLVYVMYVEPITPTSSNRT